MSDTLYFNELTVRNFLSFGNQDIVIDLSNPGTVSIEGQNLDQGGSNGAGKTTIINAICYALYNKPFDNISLQRLINSTNASKNTLMEVKLSFERSGDMYEILRTRGEQYTISITKNGDDITPGKGVIECDQLIEDIIGISYELFTKTIIFSGNATPFLALPIAQQRSQIEELFNITMLSEKAKLLKEKLKQTELDLKVQEAVMKQQELAIELHSQHTTEAEKRVSRWETERTEHILMIKSSLAVIGTVDFELEQLLHDEKNQLQTEGAYLAAKLAPIKKDHQILSRDLEKELGEQAHLMEAKCPYCLQKFADAAKKLAELSTKIDSKSTRLLQLDEDMKLFSDQIKAQATRLGEVQASIQHPNLKELLRIRENASVMQSKIDELEAAGNPHIEALERLKTETQVSVDTEKVDTLRRRLEHQQFLLKLLTNKDSFLRRRIINKTIPFLNSHINAYTASLGLPHIVKFDADLSCTVSEFGRELDFGNLSAGEKKRVNVGLALAFRDVLHHLHAKCNILLVDELDGALDVSGMDSVVRVFKDKARDEDMGIYVISHHPSIAGRLDKMLTIQKVHGFSQIIES
jgi:DNA repair exonuclease SbcCD ATPase subunit